MVKILDLFSGTCSVRKALDTMDIEYEYYGIDIYSPEEENLILDLSQDDIVAKVVAALPKGWIPDFIWASPVCDKFSIASAVKGGNIYFEKIKNGLKIRENFVSLETSVYKNKNHKDILDEATFAIKLVDNMNAIIEYYNCDFIIENPYSSYMVYYLDPLLVRNKANYCMYGYEYEKATAIYSRYNLHLKICNHKELHKSKIGSKTTKKDIQQNKRFNYQERSSVPPLLIKQILNIFLKENYETRM
jgi:hypothetical protein